MNEDQVTGYEDFVAARWTSLYRSAFLLVGDRQTAEDLLQTVLLKLYRSWPRLATIGHPEAYARRMLVNQAISWRRRRSWTESPTEHGLDVAQSGHEDRVADSEALLAALHQLPPQQRAIIVLRYYEDLSEESIATTLGISRGTVKSSSSRARETLARLLGERVTVERPTSDGKRP